MKSIKLSAVIAALAMVVSLNAFAETMCDNAGHCHEMASMQNGQENGAKGAFDNVMMKMHKDMADTKVTGNVDVDFVKGMIPHHQGAIDMAKIELAKGNDPKIQKMAKDIIKAQEKEIAMMHKWLADHKAQ
jgi:uncharacterized protein (DUF305 family)